MPAPPSEPRPPLRREVALAEKLGITRSSFYNAFGSREQLFREAMALYVQHCPDSVLMLGTPVEGSVLELIADTVRTMCRVRAADPDGKGCMAVNTVAGLVGTADPMGEEIRQTVVSVIDHLERLLRLAVERGEMEADDDLRAKALALQALLMGVQVQSKAVRSEHELWSGARETLIGLGLLPAGEAGSGSRPA